MGAVWSVSAEKSTIKLNILFVTGGANPLIALAFVKNIEMVSCSSHTEWKNKFMVLRDI